MVDKLGIARRCTPATSSDLFDFVPVRQQPSFEVVLRGVRMESGFRPDPKPHLVLRIGGVLESGIDIGYGNNGIRAIAQVPVDQLLQGLASRNQPILPICFDPWLLTGESFPEKSFQSG